MAAPADRAAAFSRTPRRTVKWNSQPWPTWLAARMLPPMRPTSREAMILPKQPKSLAMLLSAPT